MSDRMHPIPFETLLDWVFGELKTENSIFGCRDFYRAPKDAGQPYMGRTLETAVGPAAGPHTQLAQNMISAYLCGARMFELKTVQVIDGEDLPVSKPCILAEDEGYNCEWSTELTVRQAQEEYIKAWFMLHVLAKELELGRADGFVFNMSVGYDLEGIQSRKIDDYLNHMMDATHTEEFCHCKQVLAQRLDGFRHFTAEDLEAISPAICSSVTVSTMHGCPPSEIERIALYLLENKKLNLLLKCNPTLAGYDYARRVLNDLGFSYIRFERESFDHDLQYADAIPMLRRIQDKAGELGLYFGLKLTNTFAVKAAEGELPDENMYMSGRALLPLSLEVAERISREFNGDLPISYCGGANAKNIAVLRRAGFFPITVCTELLKPGGYGKLKAMAEALEGTENSGPLKPDGLSESLSSRARSSSAVRRPARPENPYGHLNCRTVCGNCASVCPNRANTVIRTERGKQLLHIDGMCNECGNCASFCAEKTAPYLEKLTVFSSAEELRNSKNAGFCYLWDSGRFLLRWEGACREGKVENGDFTEEIAGVMTAVRERYPWLLYR
ncbi:MAG: selenate reductase [Oscillospiraceae bacterium]|nr:selenate reductase [Oscillospiraceae bacterium]